MGLTSGFLNQRQLRRHFSEHGGDFGASNAQEYEGLADSFLGKPLGGNVQEGIRNKGDKVRYDTQSQEYGVLDASGIIRTYYKPVPCVTLPISARALMRLTGRCHKYANNFLYFQSECRRSF